MSRRYWTNQPAFQRLCDLVATDRLVCMTGAGISAALERRDGTRLPQWAGLLHEIDAAIGHRVPEPEDRADLDTLLGSRAPTGRQLILAASILRAAAPRAFDIRFKRLVTPKRGAFTETHEVLFGLQPRGIVTFNYDPGHENAARRLRLPRCDVLLPDADEALRTTLADGLPRTFLLKAHGSVDAAAGGELVLTSEAYRDLLVRSPAYRAFVQHVLTECHLLVVGFGLSDPDFDVFADAIIHAFGKPVRDGVAIFKRGSRPRSTVELRRSFGLQVLEVRDYPDIPRVLRDAAGTAGPDLERTLQRCVDPDFQTRARAHDELRALGPAGRAVASRVLRARLEAERDPFTRSEHAFSLGVLADRMHRVDEKTERKTIKNALIEVIDHDPASDPVARCLTVIRGLLVPRDQRRIERWERRFRRPLDAGDGGRLHAYAEYLRVFVPAKHASDP